MFEVKTYGRKFQELEKDDKITFLYPNCSATYEGVVLGKTENGSYLIGIPQGIIVLDRRNSKIKILQAKRQELVLNISCIDSMRVIKESLQFDVFMKDPVDRRIGYNIVDDVCRELKKHDVISDGINSYHVSYISEDLMVLTCRKTGQDQCLTKTDINVLNNLGIRVK